MAKLNQYAKAAGVAAEQEARWYIDRTFHESRNYRVLHDIVLSDSRSDAWCQIDHLVIGRMGHFLVLETKSAVQGMSLHAESGAWSVWYADKPKPMKSPIAQNIRHIEVLGDYLRQRQIMPKRLFLSIAPTFENWILVQPGVRLPKEYGGARLVQRDQFSQEFDLFRQRMPDSSVLKLMTILELDAVVDKLAEESQENKRVRDQPLVKSAVPSNRLSEDPPPLPDPDHRFAPPVERKAVTREEAVEKPVAAEPPTRSTISVRQKVTPCANCGGALTTKEVNYCRFNFTRMGRRYLCRNCQ